MENSEPYINRKYGLACKALKYDDFEKWVAYLLIIVSDQAKYDSL